MKVSLLFLIIIYLLIVIINLYSCYLGLKKQRILTKLLLMPILSILYYNYTPKEKFIKKIFTAQILGFFGDVVLLYDNEFYWLILGIAFFLIGHILYIITFVEETGFYNYKKYSTFFIFITSVYSMYAKFAFEKLKEGFKRGGILIPGACYVIILAVLTITSGIFAFVYFNVFSILVHIGALAFSVSDYILARRLFFEQNKYHLVCLLATYIFAQTLICIGMANKTNTIKNKK